MSFPKKLPGITSFILAFRKVWGLWLEAVLPTLSLDTFIVMKAAAFSMSVVHCDLGVFSLPRKLGKLIT